MADISKEIRDFKQAIYGEEVRGSMVTMAEKLNKEISTADQHQGSLETLNEQAAKNIKELEKLTEDTEAGFGRLGNVEKTLTEIDNKVISAQNSIKQNSDQLALKASKTELSSALDDAVRNAKSYSDSKYDSSVDYIDSQLTVASNQITSKITGVQKELSNISVGGTNLVRGSRDFRVDTNCISGFKEPTSWTKSVDSENFTEATLSATGLTSNRYTSFYSNYFPITKEPLVVSVMVKVKDLSKWDGRSFLMFETFNEKNDTRLDYVEVDFENDHGNNPKVTANQWVKFVWKKPEVNGKFGRIRLMLQRNGEISFKKLKVEYGSIPTDWSPAPEDIDVDLGTINGRLVTTETSINQNKEQIALRATKTEVTNAVKTAKDYADTQYSNSKIYTDAQLNIASDQITSSVVEVRETVDGLTVGGTNLSKKTDFGKRYSQGNIYAGNANTITVNDYELSCKANPSDLVGFIANIPSGHNVLTVSGFSDLQDVMYLWSIKNKSNTTVVTQPPAPTSIAGTVVLDESGYTPEADFTPAGSDSTDVAPADFRYNSTASNDSDYFEFQIEYDHPDAAVLNLGLGDYPYANPYKLWNVQIEVGNLATAWSPSPEDVEGDVSGLKGRVTTAETNITQNANQIALKANKTDVDNAIRTAKADIQVTTDGIKQTVESHYSELSDEIRSSYSFPLDITSVMDGDNTVLTANVFQGSKKLTDPQIYALGCLNWYKNGTKIGTGKTLTRKVDDTEEISCCLESGGGGSNGIN